MAVLEYLLIAFVVPMVLSKSFGGQDGYKTPNDTQTCVNDLTAWCEGMQYPTEGGSISMVAITIADQRGYCRALCTSDSEGTNCTKNGSPWFSCSNQNEFIYKGNVLVKDSVKGADNETCSTADNAFNDLFVQNFSYDNSTLNKEVEMGMEEFFKGMELLEEKIANMQRQLSQLFGRGFPFENRYPANSYNPSDVNTEVLPTQDQREKE